MGACSYLHSPLIFQINVSMQYTEEQLEAIMAEVIREKALERISEERLEKDYAIINSELEDDCEVHPLFGKCIGSFSIGEYAHINNTYGSDFFSDPESIRFHQKVRGQTFLRKV